MEVRSIDHAADEVLATIATPEPASGVPQVSSQAAQEPVARQSRPRRHRDCRGWRWWHHRCCSADRGDRRLDAGEYGGIGRQDHGQGLRGRQGRR